MTQQFIDSKEELALYQIVGHSYDLDVDDKWDTMENIFRLISCQRDVLPMTTIDIIRYLKAMSKAEVTEKYIKNNSDVSLWFDINNSVFEVKPGSMLVIQ